MTNDVWGIVGSLVFDGAFAVLFVLYFVPSFIALKRDRNVAVVLVLNTFLGWSLVGWVASLALALSSDPMPKPFYAVGPMYSADGRWWWDGRAWQRVTESGVEKRAV